MYTFYESPSQLNFKMFEGGEPPFVSIYLQTHRGSAEAMQDKLTYKNLVAEAERSLKQLYGKKDYSHLVESLKGLYESRQEDLWRNLKDGLAVLANNDDMIVCLLDYTLRDRSIVANSYHIRPLVRGFQFDTEYYLLELTQERFELYQGDSQGFERIELPEEMHNCYDEVFPLQGKDSIPGIGSYTAAGTGFFGINSKSDLQDIEREKRFRYTDKVVSSVLENYPRAPVILVTSGRHQTEYRLINTVEALLQTGIETRMESTSYQDILKEATALVIGERKRELAQIADGFTGAQAAGKATADPSEIASALAEQKVRVLFLEQDSITTGHLDLETGSITYEGVHHPEVDDLGDDFAQATYRQGGMVYILPSEEMPTETGMAAFFRY